MATFTYTVWDHHAISDNTVFSIPLTVTQLIDQHITDVSLTLLDISHTFIGDLDLLLLGPGDSNLQFLSDRVGGADLSHADLTFSDSAADPFPTTASQEILTGTYRPGGSPGETPDNFGLAIPEIFTATGDGIIGFGSQFGGVSANGIWTLFVRDDANLDQGDIGGWSLTLSTDGDSMTLEGASGDDVIYVTASAGGSGSYSVNAETEVAFSGVAGAVLFGYEGNDVLIGSALGETLEGGLDRDLVFAGDGNDVLSVRAPEDVVAGEIYDGGAGTDSLIIQAPTAGTVFDFRNVTIRSIEVLGFTSEQDNGSRAAVINAAQLGAGLSSTLTVVGTFDAANTDILRIFMGTVSTLWLAPLQLQNFDGPTDRIEVFGDGSNEVINGSAIMDQMYGGNGDDLLSGLLGNDVLDGGNGNDTLIGGWGADTLNGGSGIDTAQYLESGVGLRVDLLVNATNTFLAAGDVYSGVENIIGTNLNDLLLGDTAANQISGESGNDLLEGRSGNDTLIGGAGNDTLNGGVDNDVLNGGLGADQMNGGSGFDVADYTAATTAVRADLQVSGTNTGEAAGDTYALVEGILGSAQNDLLLGDASGNRLEGGAGNDLLDGRAGNDTLFGGVGNDTLNGGTNNDVLVGGSGADSLNGGDGLDTADYSSSTVGLRADLQVAGSNTQDAAGDIYVSIENLSGSINSDTLLGNAEANTIYGVAGNNLIDGRLGNDTLFGGFGNDTIFGGSGNDSLVGGLGNDELHAGLGQDTLTGAENADNFVFDTSIGPGNFVTITDFTVVDDTIVLENAIFTALPTIGVLDASAFFVGASASSSTHRIIYNSATGALLYDADGNGAGLAVQIATLSTGLAMTNDDFVVV